MYSTCFQGVSAVTHLSLEEDNTGWDEARNHTGLAALCSLHMCVPVYPCSYLSYQSPCSCSHLHGLRSLVAVPH
uniref:Uncharacterized protein n=1 Tax=Anguilla anguilla TaxID=7936 RepID=A0A0E9UVH1_ANGAN